MATFNGYVSTDGTDYQMILSEVDVTGISGDQEASIRFFDRDDATHLELTGLDLDLRNSDPYLPGGNVFHTTITETQYNSISEITSFERVDSGNTIRYIYENQVELFLGPTFDPQPIMNTTDSGTLPYVNPTNGVLSVEQDGTYELVVTDSDGLESEPLCETVDINDAINIGITAVPNFDPGDELTIGLALTDDDGTLSNVDFTVNGTSVLTSTEIQTLIDTGSFDYIYSPASADQVYVLTAEDDRDHEAMATHTATVNTTTITIQFQDDTGTGASLNSVATFTQTGNPGDPFSGFQRIVNGSTGFRINSVTCTESGDTGGNVTCSASGSSVNVSGTFPNEDTTVTLTITASITTLIAVSVVASGSEAGNVGPITTPEFGPSNPSTNSSSISFRLTFPTSAARNAGFGLVTASCASPLDFSGPFTTNSTIQSSVSNDGSDSSGFHTSVSFNGRFDYSVPEGSSFTQPAGDHSCGVSISGDFYLTGTTSRVWQGVE